MRHQIHAVPVIPPINDDALFCALTNDLTLVYQRRQSIELEIRAIDLERQASALSPPSDRQEFLLAQLRETRDALARIGQPAAAATALEDEEIAAALALATADAAPPVPTTSTDRRRELVRRREVLLRGEAALNGRRDARRDELSLHINRAITPRMNELSVATYRAAELLSAALDAEFALIRDVQAAGFDWLEHVARRHAMRLTLALGHTWDQNNVLAQTRCALREAKLID